MTMSQLGEALAELCRPFGSITHWAVDWSLDTVDEGVYHCTVKLDDPAKHELVAKRLGGEVKEHAVCLDVRLRQ